ncbi:MAG: hypothetical protein ACR2KU_09175 [Gammaproteobacteria bacterium]
MARATTAADYVVTTVADTRGMKPGALAGLAAFGDGYNALGIAAGDGKIIVWRRENGLHKTVAIVPAPNAPLVHLRMIASGGYRFRFAVSADGREWHNVGKKKGVDLPPWGHSVRVALTSGGARRAPWRDSTACAWFPHNPRRRTQRCWRAIDGRSMDRAEFIRTEEESHEGSKAILWRHGFACVLCSDVGWRDQTRG